jgi:hypothetical protein
MALFTGSVHAIYQCAAGPGAVSGENFSGWMALPEPLLSSLEHEDLVGRLVLKRGAWKRGRYPKTFVKSKRSVSGDGTRTPTRDFKETTRAWVQLMFECAWFRRHVTYLTVAQGSRQIRNMSPELPKAIIENDRKTRLY